MDIISMTISWFLFGTFTMKVFDEDTVICKLLKAKIMVKKFSTSV